MSMTNSDRMYECSRVLLHTKDFPGLHVNIDQPDKYEFFTLVQLSLGVCL